MRAGGAGGAGLVGLPKLVWIEYPIGARWRWCGDDELTDGAKVGSGSTRKLEIAQHTANQYAKENRCAVA